MAWYLLLITGTTLLYLQPHQGTGLFVLLATVIHTCETLQYVTLCFAYDCRITPHFLNAKLLGVGGISVLYLDKYNTQKMRKFGVYPEGH